MASLQQQSEELRAKAAAIAARYFMATTPECVELTGLIFQFVKAERATATQQIDEAVAAARLQPLYIDDHGTIRFKANAIVQYLLDNGGIDMNRLARMNFSVEDREQFAQLIGYSLSGYGELNYVTDKSYDTAEHVAQQLTAKQGDKS